VTHSLEPGRFRTDLATSPAECASSRDAFVRWLTSAGVEDGPRDELAVVFSELANNATRACAGSDRRAEANAWAESDSVLLEVANPVPSSVPPPRRWDMDDPLRAGGRGLMIVRAYTDDISVSATDQMVTVRCRRFVTT
jgi:anti-sigma regulatory factor (Ser/Thr protein kinase)